MICKTYASKILNTLMGATSTTTNLISTPSTVYLGLCASEPNKTSGALTSAGEPTSVASYARKLVGGKSTSTQYFGVSSSTGIIKNQSEIQMKTARENYPAKMNYWFLSENETGGSAFMWGKIKDVVCDTMTVSGFVSEDTYNAYTASAVCENLLELKDGETYIINWDGKEYEEKAVLYEDGDTSMIVIGNHGDSAEKPFGMLYSESTSGTDTVGNLTVYSLTDEASHTFAIYGIGIEIKKATVPTFYENELQASIDV